MTDTQGSLTYLDLRRIRAALVQLEEITRFVAESSKHHSKYNPLHVASQNAHGLNIRLVQEFDRLAETLNEHGKISPE